MCGFLIYPKRPDKGELRSHLALQEHRGKDGFGALHLQSGLYTKSLTVDGLCAGLDSLPQHGTVVVHHRKASIGGIKEELVHPLTTGNVIVMQNGTKRSLAEVLPVADSDTHALAMLLNATMHDKKVSAELVHGAGIVMVHTANGFFIAHDGNRSLHYCLEGEMSGMFSSEPLLRGKWAEIKTHKGVHQFGKDSTTWFNLMIKDTAHEYQHTCSGFKCVLPVTKHGDTCLECSKVVAKSYGYGWSQPSYSQQQISKKLASEPVKKLAKIERTATPTHIDFAKLKVPAMVLKGVL